MFLYLSTKLLELFHQNLPPLLPQPLEKITKKINVIDWKIQYYCREITILFSGKYNIIIWRIR